MITSGHFSFVETIPFTGGTWDRLLVARDQRESARELRPERAVHRALDEHVRGERTRGSRSRRPDPTCDRHHSVRGEDRDEHSLELPAHVAPLAPIGVVPHHLEQATNWTCWLEVLDAGSWKAPGAHAKLNAKGTCRISARFASPGRQAPAHRVPPGASFGALRQPSELGRRHALGVRSRTAPRGRRLSRPPARSCPERSSGLASSTSHASTGVEPG